MDTPARRLAERLPVTTGATLTQVVEGPDAVLLEFAGGRSGQRPAGGAGDARAAGARPRPGPARGGAPVPDRRQLHPGFLTRPRRRIDYAGDRLPLRPNSEAAGDQN
ncbi:hypothetical protein ACFZB9_21240 [Kitasatospora sp. NPDC008050]|uniref:hypothetical protein n=1 Tax=Kitasatospora sp. NPDC008050 TaxID=3364021 RepID=UPI0036E98DD0